MTRLVNEQADTDIDIGYERLQTTVFPSPGGYHEFITVLLSRKRTNRAEIKGLKGEMTGLRRYRSKFVVWMRYGRCAQEMGRPEQLSRCLKDCEELRTYESNLRQEGREEVNCAHRPELGHSL